MKPLSAGLKRLLLFTAAVCVISVGYYVYALFAYTPTEENETFLTEIGEGLGEVALWLLLFIYMRTVMKLLLGKGPIAKRILPEYTPPVDPKLFNRFMHFLDRTHVYVGIGAVAIILLHAVLAGIPMQILFFPAVLLLVVWQGLFGLFISWRHTPNELKKFSYLVHAQLSTGIMIGVFAYLGHVLIDD